MYLNSISFKNGRVINFKTEIPYSIDKVNTEWGIITDALSGATQSFRTSEIVTISTIKEQTKKQPKIKTAITTE